MANPELHYRAYTPEDEPAILELFEQSFKRPLSSTVWRWRFLQNPSGAGMIQLAWDGDTLAAHYAITQAELAFEGEPLKSGLSGTTMTHPNYRGLGLFPLLAERTYAQMADNGLALVWGYPNTMSHRVFVTDVHWRDIYETPFFRAQTSAIQNLPKPKHVSPLERFDARFDTFWHAEKQRYRIIGRRDQAQLNWRYVDNPSDTYMILASAPAGDLDGYLVYKRYKDELQIVDVLIQNVDVGLELLAAVVMQAQETNAESVAMWLALDDDFHRALEKRGFLPAAPITYFGARLLKTDRRLEAAYDYHQWFLTMGDSDVY